LLVREGALMYNSPQQLEYNSYNSCRSFCRNRQELSASLGSGRCQQSQRIWSEMHESGLETVVGVDAEAEDGCDFHRLVAPQGGLELPTAES
jgi:hypothetical protein